MSFKRCTFSKCNKVKTLLKRALALVGEAEVEFLDLDKKDVRVFCTILET